MVVVIAELMEQVRKLENENRILRGENQQLVRFLFPFYRTLLCYSTRLFFLFTILSLLLADIFFVLAALLPVGSFSFSVSLLLLLCYSVALCLSTLLCVIAPFWVLYSTGHIGSLVPLCWCICCVRSPHLSFTAPLTKDSRPPPLIDAPSGASQ